MKRLRIDILTLKILEAMTFMRDKPDSNLKWIYQRDDADLASRALDLFKRDIGMMFLKTKSSSRTKSAADMVSVQTTTAESNRKRFVKEISAIHG